MMATKPISEADLQAYIDGQLDMRGRIEIERRLQAEPIAAARVMEELRLRDELRLFMTDEAGPAPPATVALARDLSRRLRARSNRRRLRRATAAAVLIGAGWLAHAEFGLIVDQVAAAHPIPTLAAEAAAAVDLLQNGAASAETLLPSLVAPRTGGEVPIPPLGGGCAPSPRGARPNRRWADPGVALSVWRRGSGEPSGRGGRQLRRHLAAVGSREWPSDRLLEDRPVRLRGQRRYPGSRAPGDRPPSGARSLATIQFTFSNRGNTPWLSHSPDLTRQPAGRARSSSTRACVSTCCRSTTT